MKKSVMREEQRLALLLIVRRIPKFITSFVAAVVSGSMAVWLEFMENVSILIPGVLIAVLSGAMKHNLKYQFNYGTGKLEALTAFACEIFDIAGLLCIDIEISFLPETPYGEVTKTVAQMRERIEQELGKSVVNFVIREGNAAA